MPGVGAGDRRRRGSAVPLPFRHYEPTPTLRLGSRTSVALSFHDVSPARARIPKCKLRRAAPAPPKSHCCADDLRCPHAPAAPRIGEEPPRTCFLFLPPSARARISRRDSAAPPRHGKRSPLYALALQRTPVDVRYLLCARCSVSTPNRPPASRERAYAGEPLVQTRLSPRRAKPEPRSTTLSAWVD